MAPGEGCARPQSGLQVQHADEGSAWLEVYWAASKPFRGRFKAMTARPPVGLRKVRVLSNTRTLSHG